jgi:hypothetical protein
MPERQRGWTVSPLAFQAYVGSSPNSPHHTIPAACLSCSASSPTTRTICPFQWAALRVHRKDSYTPRPPIIGVMERWARGESCKASRARRPPRSILCNLPHRQSPPARAYRQDRSSTLIEPAPEAPVRTDWVLSFGGCGTLPAGRSMHDVRARLPVGTVERDPEKGSACAIGDLDLPSLRHPCSKEALLREFRDGAPHGAERHREGTGRPRPRRGSPLYQRQDGRKNSIMIAVPAPTWPPACKIHRAARLVADSCRHCGGFCGDTGDSKLPTSDYISRLFLT